MSWSRGGWGPGLSHQPLNPLFSKLPTPTPLHTFRVKSSLHQIALASSRLCVKLVCIKSSASYCHVPVGKGEECATSLPTPQHTSLHLSRLPPHFPTSPLYFPTPPHFPPTSSHLSPHPNTLPHTSADLPPHFQTSLYLYIPLYALIVISYNLVWFSDVP